MASFTFGEKNRFQLCIVALIVSITFFGTPVISSVSLLNAFHFNAMFYSKCSEILSFFFAQELNLNIPLLSLADYRETRNMDSTVHI